MKDYTPVLSYRQVGSDTSWFHLYEDGLILAQVQLTESRWKAENKMKRIVNAVNSHEELVKLLKEVTTVKLMYDNPKLVCRIQACIARAESEVQS